MPAVSAVISCQKFFSSPASNASLPARTMTVLNSLNDSPSPSIFKKFPKRHRDEINTLKQKQQPDHELTPKRQKSLVYDQINEDQENQATGPTLTRWNRSSSLSLSSKGFSNLGNTCYMNAILQCLLNIQVFKNDLLANYEFFKDKVCVEDQEGLLSTSPTEKKKKLCLY